MPTLRTLGVKRVLVTKRGYFLRRDSSKDRKYVAEKSGLLLSFQLLTYLLREAPKRIVLPQLL
jgi:hypothetical protein